MSGPSSWRADVESLLEELSEIDFGYPIDENGWRESRSSDEIDTVFARLDLGAFSQLRSFYEICDGISWPDVHNGYFLKSLSELTQGDAEPTRLEGKLNADILVIGSSGGGDLIALRRHEQDVLWLPPAMIEDGVYDSNEGRVRIVGADFWEFAARLRDDLAAFVDFAEDHRFLDAI